MPQVAQEIQGLPLSCQVGEANPIDDPSPGDDFDTQQFGLFSRILVISDERR